MLRRRSTLRHLAVMAAGQGLAACTVGSTRVASLPAHCLQLITVVAPSWTATSGALRRLERASADAPWTAAGPDIPVVLGRSGLRPGRGLVRPISGRQPKREGDGASPAGLFSLGTAFGTAPRAMRPRHWPWLSISPHHAGVDDPASAHYNRIVDRRLVSPDWRSAEDMRPPDGVYRLGLVVEHNHDQKPAAGSCIFVHLWKSPATPTAGCTAMAEPDLVRLLQWLRRDASPLFLQLPSAAIAPWRAAGVPFHA